VINSVFNSFTGDNSNKASSRVKGGYTVHDWTFGKNLDFMQAPKLCHRQKGINGDYSGKAADELAFEILKVLKAKLCGRKNFQK